MPPDSKALDLNDILTKQGTEAALEWLTRVREIPAEENSRPIPTATIDDDPFEPEDIEDLDQGDVPPREWLLGTVLCRSYVTVLAAFGGAGKTSLAIAWALSLASGRALVGDHVHRRCRVLILTFEDDRQEYRRRLRAARLHHAIGQIGRGWCFVKSLNGLGITLVEPDRDRIVVDTGAADRIMQVIERHNVDVVVLDPFIKISGAPENDNPATDAVARILARIAEQRNVAVLVLHHFRKGAAEAGNMDAARGARSLIDAARIACPLLPMSPDEAKAFGVGEDERRRLVRLDDGKVNIALSSTKPRWYRLASVNLNNGTAAYPSGDNVQAIEHWSAPETWKGLSNALLNRILDDIDAGMEKGERYSGAPSAKTRAAWRIVQRHAPDKTEPQCREIVKTWIANGLLVVEEYTSPNERKPFEGLRVHHSKRPGPSAQ
jgi:AAA domain